MPAAAAPTNGELRDSANVLIAGSQLGKGCLYFGGGTNVNVPGARIPTGSDSYFSIVSQAGTVLTIGPSAGIGAKPQTNCTNPAGPGTVCVDNVNFGNACTTDANCSAIPGACQLAGNCFFGPPLPLPNPTNNALSTCIINFFSTTPSGTIDTAAGGPATVNVGLQSRVYLTGNFTQPCPLCNAGVCSRGPNVGQACTALASGLTSTDCRSDGTYQTSLPIGLNPLTTGATNWQDLRCANVAGCPNPSCAFKHCFTDADCNNVAGACTGAGLQLFCPGQTLPKKGAFGKPTASRILENGASGGAIPACGSTASREVGSVFCIGSVGPTIDPVAGLPGPGAINLVTNMCTQ